MTKYVHQLFKFKKFKFPGRISQRKMPSGFARAAVRKKERNPKSLVRMVQSQAPGRLQLKGSVMMSRQKSTQPWPRYY